MSSVEVFGTLTREVVIGSTVEVQWDDGGRGRYLIGAETDLAQNVLGVDAPLARAICGASAGEVRTYRAGRCFRSVTVLQVEGSLDVAG
jgi:transcription elongation GreA/GreB family factor